MIMMDYTGPSVINISRSYNDNDDDDDDDDEDNNNRKLINVINC